MEKQHHYEKTVEWLYVRNHLPELKFGAPLAGPNEAAGDAIIADDWRWAIIEFKCEKGDIETERRKYPALQKDRGPSVEMATVKAKMAFDELVTSYGYKDGSNPQRKAPHVFVFGLPSKKGLRLRGCYYWTSWAHGSLKDRPVGVGSILKVYGEGDFEVFKSYVHQLVTAKGNSASGTEEWSHAAVVGLQIGKHTGCSMTMAQFQRKFGPTPGLTTALKNPQTQSGQGKAKQTIKVNG